MYTFVPKEKYAKANGVNLSISTKSSVLICRKIRGKKVDVAEKFLSDLLEKKRSIDGKYYTTAVKEILKLLRSCKANAENLDLDTDNLIVHASAHKGPTIKRRRRKSGFGNRMKITNIEIMLIENNQNKKSKDESNNKLKGDTVERKDNN